MQLTIQTNLIRGHWVFPKIVPYFLRKGTFRLNKLEFSPVSQNCGFTITYGSHHSPEGREYFFRTLSFTEDLLR